MNIDPQLGVIIIMALGGAISLATWYITERRQRPLREAEARERASRDAEKARRDALIYDEIVGHKDMPGVPDKVPMAKRLETVEAGVRTVVRELHPNGGASLADTINATHRLAEQAADHSLHVAEALEESTSALDAHADFDDERFQRVMQVLAEIRKAIAGGDLDSLKEALDRWLENPPDRPRKRTP